MLKTIISEIAAYEQVANNPHVVVSQKLHALMMVVGLCLYLRDEYNISLLEIITLIDEHTTTDK